MKGARPSVLFGLAVAAAAVAVAPAAAGTRLAPLTPAPADGLSRALAAGEVSEARYALDRAKALFTPGPLAARYGSVATLHPRAATFVLRDLALRLDELSPEHRAAAERMMARPSDRAGDPEGDGWQAHATGENLCTGRFCVHWVSNTKDAPPLADSDLNGTPDWIEETRRALDRVFDRQIDELGFPTPKDDTLSETASAGNPDGTLDVYLADIGDDGLYGYCWTDDPDLATRFDVSAYCVLDDDFEESQFPFGAHGQAANKVTIAHEIHHAEQFALDIGEDRWIMESTATKMEHVVYPGIRDNYQYLRSSQIAQPRVPLDLSDPTAGSLYGNWIFFQHLAERFGGPEIMRDIWRRLDAREGRPDDYSSQGVQNVLEKRGRDLRKVYAGFALANRRPGASYDLQGLPRRLDSPTELRYRLGRGAPRRAASPRLHHLTSAWFVFKRRGDTPRSADLLLRVDLPSKKHGAAARAIVTKRSGNRTVHGLPLDRDGESRKLLPFGGKVRKVELLLVNGSKRFSRCYRWGSPYSCSGRPRDDNRRFSFAATLR